MAMCFAPGVQSHPHHWIDVFAEWQFDTKGLINGVELRWLFDDYYSVLLLNDAAATEEKLQVILKRLMGNTAKHHYFLRIDDEGDEARLGNPEQAKIGMRDHRVEIPFRQPIKTRLDPGQGDIVYRVAESTY